MSTVRPARFDDHAAFARLFPELAVPDRAPDAETWWRQRGATTVMAEEDGEIAGYLYFEVLSDTLYIRNVVSDPRLRGRGHGRALMVESMRLGREKGASRWCLNVKEDNVPAIALYRSLGLQVTWRHHLLRWPWAELSLLPKDSAISARPVPPKEDEVAETAWSLPRGLLAARRAAGFLVLGVDDAEGSVGLAAFDPGHPGAFPFRARDVPAARALFEGMVPARRPLDGEAWRNTMIQFAAENNEPLAEAFMALGAERLFVILHMKGELS